MSNLPTLEADERAAMAAEVAERIKQRFPFLDPKAELFDNGLDLGVMLTFQPPLGGHAVLRHAVRCLRTDDLDADIEASLLGLRDWAKAKAAGWTTPNALRDDVERTKRFQPILLAWADTPERREWLDLKEPVPA